MRTKPPSENSFIYQAVTTTPLGKLGLMIAEEKLLRLDWLPTARALFSDEKPITVEIMHQLQQYFSGTKTRWELLLAPAGTPFQQRVWQALQAIPAGEVLTYGQLAQRLQSAPRAVGQACRNNPISIIIPCHRVIAAQGWGGYSGAIQGKQLRIKKWLLQHEGYRR